MSEFDDIRPYRDNEVQEILKKTNGLILTWGTAWVYEKTGTGKQSAARPQV